MKPFNVHELEKHPKQWGFEIWVVNENYCGKLLFFAKAHTGTSMHYHRHKAETMMVLDGSCSVEIGGESYVLQRGDAINIPPMMPHRFTAGEEGTTVIEFSTHHDDEDSYRIGPRLH